MGPRFGARTYSSLKAADAIDPTLAITHFSRLTPCRRRRASRPRNLVSENPRDNVERRQGETRTASPVPSVASLLQVRAGHVAERRGRVGGRLSAELQCRVPGVP